jgi:hypothetical protein
MIFCVEEDREHEAYALEDGDAFDRRRAHLLDVEAELLRDQAERLIATGSISIQRPDGMVAARLRRTVWRYRGGGRWHRRPLLDIEGKPADDSGRRASRHGPMVAKYRDRANLLSEIIMQLSIYLAWLEDDQ